MQNANGELPTKDDPLMMCKPVRQRIFAAGQLIIRPMQIKRNQYVRNDTMVHVGFLVYYLL